MKENDRYECWEYGSGILCAVGAVRDIRSGSCRAVFCAGYRKVLADGVWKAFYVQENAKATHRQKEGSKPGADRASQQNGSTRK